MQIRFLLGPAGSGKTFRCLSEIRECLREDPSGDPLIFFVPKQATFQLERQLLADASLPGYTRLQIVSFERFARFVFDQLERPVPELLAEEGRVMVLRALLEQRRAELQVFRASAHMPGFARQLSQLLRELQQHRISAGRLETLAAEVGESNRLGSKLRDLALIYRAYFDRLKQDQLQDADALLDLAAHALKHEQPAGSGASTPLRFGGLWLDGFAQMTPQERQLLAAAVQCSGGSTLAFCLDGQPGERPPWHSAWAPVTETFLRCRDELGLLPGSRVQIETLSQDPDRSRFAGEPLLQQLESSWGRWQPAGAPSRPSKALRLVACVDPQQEAEFAAREIRRHVREGGRFRDIAVLLRSLENYHDVIRRVFTRFEIPLFLDRREPVSHHPLAELTRYALRLAAYGWEHDDWFGALKTGLVHAEDWDIDWIENEAIARGWRGRTFWTSPFHLPNAPDTLVQKLESLRQQLVPPFDRFVTVVSLAERRLNGTQLASAIRQLWIELKVDRTLESWAAHAETGGASSPRLHETVWDQMNEWLANIDLAFRQEALALHDWLPVVEAGLGNLTVGVIPPALDQVLVGSVDRSRNPDLQLAFVLGVNEGVFPAAPPVPALLNRADRERLAEFDALTGPGFLNQVGLERFYGYIACTRARAKTVITFAHRDKQGRELNPSVFVHDLRALFPFLDVEEFTADTTLAGAEHWSETIVPILKDDRVAGSAGLPEIPEIENAMGRWKSLRELELARQLPAELAGRLYGPELHSSVSALEDFAACPFRFFIGHGLRAEERVEFEIDPREKGSFQHEVLKAFHEQLQRSGRRWRDVSPAEARLLVRQIGHALLPQFKEGLFVSAQARRFTGELLIEGLERLMETLIAWTRHYQFDPAAVELGFGLKDSTLPAWRIDIDQDHALLLRGRIDRVDLCRIEETGETLAVVIDYKSSFRQIDRTMFDQGLQLQLLAYLGALEQFTGTAGGWDVGRIIPAGAFYVSLRGGGSSVATRDQAREEREIQRLEACQHRGRFDGGHLLKFDSRGSEGGGQFRFSLKQDGSFSKKANEAVPAGEFRELVRQVREFLRVHGQAIYAGSAEPSPFRFGQKTACDHCDYRPVCRFDSWTQPFRVLKART